MVNTVDTLFVYHVTKPIQSFVRDNASYLIWYTNVTPYIVNFDVIRSRDSHYSPEAIVFQLTCYSVVFLLQTPKFATHMAVRTISASYRPTLIVFKGHLPFYIFSLVNGKMKKLQLSLY